MHCVDWERILRYKGLSGTSISCGHKRYTFYFETGLEERGAQATTQLDGLLWNLRKGGLRMQTGWYGAAFGLSSR